MRCSSVRYIYVIDWRGKPRQTGILSDRFIATQAYVHITFAYRIEMTAAVIIASEDQ